MSLTLLYSLLIIPSSLLLYIYLNVFNPSIHTNTQIHKERKRERENEQKSFILLHSTQKRRSFFFGSNLVITTNFY